MSFHVLSWVGDHSPTKGAARLLLVMMADMANDAGEFYCTNAHLAKRCNVKSVRAIQLQVRALAQAGAIKIISQAAESGRSINNAYQIVTPGRHTQELRSRSPRVKKPSPSPQSEPEAPRVKESSPSHPEETFTLTPKDPSPSPRRDLHPHIETVSKKPTKETVTTQQQQPRTRPKGGGLATVEEVEALTHAVKTFSEITGEDFDYCAVHLTSGAIRKGGARCLGTLNFASMRRDHARRSILDANFGIRCECHARGITEGQLIEIQKRVQPEAPL